MHPALDNWLHWPGPALFSENVQSKSSDEAELLLVKNCICCAYEGVSSRQATQRIVILVLTWRTLDEQTGKVTASATATSVNRQTIIV